jgi:hypothetical protein
MELGSEMEPMHQAVTAEQCSHICKRKEIRIPNKKASYHIHIERVASGVELWAMSASETMEPIQIGENLRNDPLQWHGPRKNGIFNRSREVKRPRIGPRRQTPQGE